MLLRKRVELQNSGEYKQFVMIADLQALTDNADNPGKIRENIMEVMLDYLAVGLEPEKTTFLIQSQIPALYGLPESYMCNKYPLRGLCSMKSMKGHTCIQY